MKKAMVFTAACVAALTLSLNHSTHAQLLEWDMYGVDQSVPTLTASTSDGNISLAGSSGLLSRGDGAALPGSSGSNSFGATGFDSADLAGAITADDYFSFSMAPVAGYEMTITGLEFNMEITTSGPSDGALFSSVGGFGAGQEIGSYEISTGAGGGDQSFDLSRIAAFEDIGGSVEFRIYGWNGGTSTTDKFRFRNLSSGDLQIDGTTALIPEPSAVVLLGAASVLLGLSRRRARLKSLRTDD